MIAAAFPTETPETYYTPAANRKPPGGKLHSQYINYQSRLAEVGLIVRRHKSGGETTLQEQITEISAVAVTALETVKGNDWEDSILFFDSWLACFDERQLILSSDITKKEYLDLFPYLKNAEGYELVRFSLKIVII